jgi:hypothetical protein
MENLKYQTEHPLFITREGIEALDEICNMCFFSKQKERKAFWKAVFKAAGSTGLHDITDDGFEGAYYTAKAILQKRGRDVFRQHKNRSTQLQSYRYEHIVLQRWNKLA